MLSWRSASGRWLLVVAVLGSGIAFLDATVVNVALPDIGRDLHASTSTLQWILNGYALSHAGVAVDARVYTRREAQLAALMIERKAADGSRSLLCPMPGLVKAIAVKVGQEVKAGEQLCIVEAMKMENVLNAERDATVKAILAKEGDSLAVDAVIMEFA